jgi:outer membrane lipoprotein
MLISCAPVLSPDIMQRAALNIQLSELKKDPGFYKGWLFIIGGIIINTEVTEEGSVIEAVRVPVNSRGHLESIETATGRYLAIYPEDKGLLEPIIFRKNRQMTLAGKFIGIQTMKINEVERVYPVFEIRELHLWRQWKTDSSGQTTIELERRWKMDYETSQSFHITSGDDDRTITEVPDKSSVFYRKLQKIQPAQAAEEVQTRDTDSHESTDSEQQQANKTKTVEVMGESNKLPEKEQTVDQIQSITESADRQAVDEEPSDKLTQQEPTMSGQIKEVTEEAEKLKVKEEVSEVKKSSAKDVATESIEYYVQVGTWRNSKYAEDMLAKIKKYYANAHIVEHNNLNKIRIPGIATKRQGTIMSKDIEDKFKLKPLLVQKIQ